MGQNGSGLGEAGYKNHRRVGAAASGRGVPAPNSQIAGDGYGLAGGAAARFVALTSGRSK